MLPRTFRGAATRTAVRCRGAPRESLFERPEGVSFDSRPRRRAAPSAAARRVRRLFPSPFWPVKKGTPERRPPAPPRSPPLTEKGRRPGGERMRNRVSCPRMAFDVWFDSIGQEKVYGKSRRRAEGHTSAVRVVPVPSVEVHPNRSRCGWEWRHGSSGAWGRVRAESERNDRQPARVDANTVGVCPSGGFFRPPFWPVKTGRQGPDSG
jgi:hypothetical protein